MATVTVKIGNGYLEVEQDDTRFRIPATEVRLEIEQLQQPLNLNLKCETQGSVGTPAPTSESRGTAAGGVADRRPAERPRKRRVLRKTLADFIEEVFSKHDRPLTTAELAEFLPQETEYSPRGGRTLPSTVRTALARNADRFVQYDSSTWGLLSREPDWKARGLLDALARPDKQQDAGAQEDDHEG